MSKLTILSFALVILSFHFAQANSPFQGSINCRAAGIKGSSVTLTVKAGAANALRPEIKLDSKIYTFNDLDNEINLKTVNEVYYPEEISVSPNGENSIHLEAVISQNHGGCLGSCGKRIFQLNFDASQNRGYYKIFDSRFSEQEGRTVQTPVSHLYNMVCTEVSAQGSN